MTTVVDFENVVRAWVEAISGRQCYIQEQMGPEPPPEQYCTIYMLNIEYPQYDTLERTCVPGDLPANTQYFIRVRGQARVTFAVSAWGGAAHDVMRVCNRLRNSLQSDRQWHIGDPENGIPAGLFTVSGLGESGNIIPIPEEYEGERRQRAEFNLTLHTALEDVFEVGFFDEVDITCRVDGDKERTIRVGINDVNWEALEEGWDAIDTNWELIG